MVLVCLFQPPTPASNTVAAATAASAATNPMLAALDMLGNTNYLIFILAQLVVSGMMQFYFLGTGQFMQDRGISGKNVSAAMGMAQAVQAVATIFLLGLLIKEADSNGRLPSAHCAGPCCSARTSLARGALGSCSSRRSTVWRMCFS